VLSKLGLLGYLLRHRRASVFKDSQPVFCGITLPLTPSLIPALTLTQL